MRRGLTCFLALLLTAVTAPAWAISISGEVTCLGDGSALSGITVTASQGPSSSSAVTGGSGAYVIGGLSGGGDWNMSVDTPYPVSGPATVTITQENPFPSGVDYQIDDPACRASFCGDGILDPGEACDDGNNIDGDGCSAMCTIESFCGDGILDPGEQCDDGNNINGDGCSAICTFEGGGEGCTPGYWRQEHHFDSYPAAYPPETLFNVAFGVEAFDDGLTLAAATRLRGGGLNALGRHAAAALLNAASEEVSYDRSVDQVIATFQEAFASGGYRDAKNLFEAFNEQSCPLN